MSITTNAFWLAVCRTAADLSSFALFAAISRVFGPAGAGEYSYGYAVAGFVAIIAASGLDEYGVRDYARPQLTEDGRRALWRDLLAVQALRLVLGLLLLALFLALARHAEASSGVILALAVYLVGWTLSRTLFVPAFAAQAMVVPAFAELACRLGAALVSLLLVALLPASLPVVLLAFPVAGVALAALAWRNATRRHGALAAAGGMARAAFGPTLTGSAPFALAELLGQFYARTDLLLIAYLIGAVGTGFYATGVKFVEVGLVPLALLGQAAYPVLSRTALDEPARFQAAASDLVRTILLLGALLALGVAFVVPPLIVPLFGAAFAATPAILPWFGALALAKAGEVACFRLLYATRRQNVYLKGLVAGTLLNLALNLILIPAFGVKGAAVAALVGTLTIALVCGLGLRRQLPLRALAGPLARLLAALAAAAALGAGLARLLAGPAGLWLPAAGALGLFALLAFLLGLVPDPRRTLLLRAGTAGT